MGRGAGMVFFIPVSSSSCHLHPCTLLNTAMICVHIQETQTKPRTKAKTTTNLDFIKRCPHARKEGLGVSGLTAVSNPYLVVLAALTRIVQV
ncbi:hypothetical protein V1506DRAFT_536620 [Lipomyces tetrasporus]